MTQPHPPPEPPPATPPTEPMGDDWLLTKGAPTVGLAIAGSFGVGVLAGLVKDIPPGLAAIVLVLLGARAAGKRL